MRAITFPVLAAAALSGCDAASPATATDANFRAAEFVFENLDALPAPAIADLPATAANYSGKFFGIVDVNDVPDHDIIGDLELNVDFAGSAQVTGEVSNINLLSQDSPDQLLGGTLDIAGSASSGLLDATASGTLDLLRFDLPFRAEADVSFIMNGSAREDVGVSNTDTSVVGTWTGGTTEVDPEFTMDGSGSFYGSDS